MYRTISLLLVLTLVTGRAVLAEDEVKKRLTSPAEKTSERATAEAEQPKKSAPPLPLQSIEGSSGILLTQTAYFANPPQGDDWIGLPSLSLAYANFGPMYLQTMGVTTTILDRLELGYSYEHFDIGHWPRDIQGATGLHISRGSIDMHNLNLRLTLVKEGDWGIKWMPAITAGVHYKYNEDILDINRNLQGAARQLGFRNNEGWDATFVASKTFADILPKPFILSAGLRSTRAAHTGFAGFTGERDIVFEGSAVFFITDRLLFATEYRQKPRNLKKIPRLVEKEDDWWDVGLAYIVNDNLTIAVVYLNLGDVLSDRNVEGWGIQLKWEF